MGMPSSASGPPRWVIAAGALALVAVAATLYLTPKPRPVFYVSASLEPGAARATQWLDLPPEATGAQLELRNVPARATQVLLRDAASGDIVWRGPISLTVAIIPASVFRREGDYVINTADSAGADILDYSFRVRKSAP
jgi:hypothetical protein